MSPSSFIEAVQLTPAEKKTLASAAKRAEKISDLIDGLRPQSTISTYNGRSRLKIAADDAAQAFADDPSPENAKAILSAHSALHAAEQAWPDVQGRAAEALASIDAELEPLALDIIRRAKGAAEQSIASTREGLAALPGIDDELRAFERRAAACIEAFSGEFEAVRSAPLGHLQSHGIGLE
jgi:hypothetical protein